jgi:hypothetical protein
MKLNLWNVLSVFTLAVTAGVGVLYLQIFINPYASTNPFPPPTLPAALVLPSSTPTLRKMPATWTYTPEAGSKNIADLLPSSTLRPSETPVNFPTSTPTPTTTLTPTATNTRTKTPAHTRTRTPTDEDDDDVDPTHTKTVKPTYATATAAAKQTKTQAAFIANQTKTQAAFIANQTKTQAAINNKLTQTAAALPANPSSATETSHGLSSNTCQKTFGDPAFSWSGVKGATGYYVYWGSDSGGTSSNQQSGTTFSPGATGSGKHYLRVRTIFGSLEQSSWSTLFIFCYDTDPPNNPDKVSVSGAKDGEWTSEANPSFSWSGASDAGSGVLDYYVYWGIKDTGTSPNSQPGASYSPHLTSSNKYYLRVRTEDKLGNLASWTTLFNYWYDGTNPGDPQNLAENGSPAGKLKFTWDDATDAHSGVDHYELYFGTDGSASSPNQSNTSGTSFTSDDLTDAGTYEMKVRAVDGVGNKSSWASASASFTPPP